MKTLGWLGIGEGIQTMLGGVAGIVPKYIAGTSAASTAMGNLPPAAIKAAGYGSIAPQAAAMTGMFALSGLIPRLTAKLYGAGSKLVEQLAKFYPEFEGAEYSEKLNKFIKLREEPMQGWVPGGGIGKTGRIPAYTYMGAGIPIGGRFARSYPTGAYQVVAGTPQTPMDKILTPYTWSRLAESLTKPMQASWAQSLKNIPVIGRGAGLIPSMGGAIGAVGLGAAAYGVTKDKATAIGTAIFAGMGAAAKGPVGMILGAAIGGFASGFLAHTLGIHVGKAAVWAATKKDFDKMSDDELLDWYVENMAQSVKSANIPVKNWLSAVMKGSKNAKPKSKK